MKLTTNTKKEIKNIKNKKKTIKKWFKDNLKNKKPEKRIG